MTPIYESDLNYTSPLMKWGIDVSKMRRKAFNSYKKNYTEGLTQWPEFRQEFDYMLSMRKEVRTKAKTPTHIKGIKFPSFLPNKNFLKYLLLSHSD